MMKIPSIFRYPGSKLKFLPALIPYVERQFFAAPQRFDEYVEPYFGGGAGLAVLQCLPRSTRVRINDLDPGVCALWQAVQRHPEQLKAAIRQLRPTVKLFYKLKQLELASSYTGNIVKDGLHKVALNRLSVSGYGSKSGGPLGGRKQSNPRGLVDARWSVPYLCQAINRANRILSRFQAAPVISGGPANAILAGCHQKTFVYLDPPYVQKGGCLYSTNMMPVEHEQMVQLLQQTKAGWLLSYDDCEWVGRSYQWAEIERVQLQYSNRREKTTRADCVEVFIYPKCASGGTGVVPRVVI